MRLNAVRIRESISITLLFRAGVVLHIDDGQLRNGLQDSHLSVQLRSKITIQSEE